MNWKIAFSLWLKGLGIFAGICVFMLPIGLVAMVIALFISWLAIPVYATFLWVVKTVGFSYKAAISIVLVGAAPVSVGAALYLMQIFDNGLSEFIEPVTFWVPLLCCIFSIFLSGNSIRQYLDGEEAIAKYITE